MKKIVIMFVILFNINIMYFNKSLEASMNEGFNDDRIETPLESFDIDTRDLVVYNKDGIYRTAFLFEGVTDSYMIYDNLTSEVLMYCYDSHSPWKINNSPYQKTGYLYLTNNLFAYVNLEDSELHESGEIFIINDNIDIYVDKTVLEYWNDDIVFPEEIDFSNLLENNVADSYVINDSYYFEMLNKNLAMNINNSCQYVAMNMLLSYYDIFYDDNLVSDDYMINSNVINRHNFDKSIDSPGGGELLDTYLKELSQEFEYENTNASLYLDLIELYMDSFYESCNYQQEVFDIILVNDLTLAIGNTNTSDYVDIRDVINLNYPVFLGCCPFYYYENDLNEWNEDAPMGHAFIVYGYYLMNIPAHEFSQTLYFLTNMGFKDENGDYKYTKNLIKHDFNAAPEGFTLIPNNNFSHNCSDSYITKYNDCVFGICPCDKNISDYEFYNKYGIVEVVDQKEMYYCKLHDGQHLIYEGSHSHNLEEIYLDEQSHLLMCTTNGCDFNELQLHQYEHTKNMNNHYDICVCGNIVNYDYTYSHYIDINGKHFEVCEDCGLSTETIFTESVFAISEHFHQYYCEECSNYIIQPHKLSFSCVNNDTHIRYCLYCDYFETTFHDAWGTPLEIYWNQEEQYYDVYCILCGLHYIIEKDDLEYEDN